MKYPLVRELAGDGFPVTVTCRVLKFSPQGYYQWLARPVTTRDYENAYLTNAAIDAHHDDPVFGYRFIADELERAGFVTSERRMWRICSEQEIFCSFSKRAGRSKRPGPAVHDDHVQRDFSASRPNEVWLTDITEHRTAEGKLYLCAIKDLYSNRIVGYAIDERMRASLAVRALRNAIRLRDPHGTIVHSDRGSQFRSKAFVRVLRNNGLVGSMGRVASAGDNAAMESFNSLLQNNVLDTRRWETREDLQLAIVTWIERTYHRRRRQRALGKMTPIEFEALDVVLKAA
jgi:transposase InsO family protein